MRDIFQMISGISFAIALIVSYFVFSSIFRSGEVGAVFALIAIGSTLISILFLVLSLHIRHPANDTAIAQRGDNGAKKERQAAPGLWVAMTVIGLLLAYIGTERDGSGSVRLAIILNPALLALLLFGAPLMILVGFIHFARTKSIISLLLAIVLAFLFLYAGPYF